MSSPEDDCQSKDPDFNPEEIIVTKRRGRKARASKFPNFVEHAAKQKLEKKNENRFTFGKYTPLCMYCIDDSYSMAAILTYSASRDVL